MNMKQKVDWNPTDVELKTTKETVTKIINLKAMMQ